MTGTAGGHHDFMDHAFQPPGPVLVVDDDRLVLLTLSHGLRRAGFDVIEADNGDDAILLARERRPCMAVLDIRMQGLSGFDVAQHFKDYERIPFLFVSAYADERSRRQAADLGALACLSKPVDMARLCALLTQAVQAGPTGDPQDQGAPGSALPAPGPNLPESALAVGLLMQRQGMDRLGAWQYLAEQARRQAITPEEAASRLLSAHESGTRLEDGLPADPA